MDSKPQIGLIRFLQTKIRPIWGVCLSYCISKYCNGYFEMKRNIITNSSEYYNLSYEYLNDCLRAGLVYRREFYNDSELEPENSLMFKITLVPFGDINSPSFSQ